MKTSFDEQVKNIYDSGEFEYNPANWDKLQKQLHPNHKDGKSTILLGVLGFMPFNLFSAAASVLVAFGLSITYYINDTHHEIAKSSHRKATNIHSKRNVLDTPIIIAENSINTSTPSASMQSIVLSSLSNHSYSTNLIEQISSETLNEVSTIDKQLNPSSINHEIIVTKGEESKMLTSGKEFFNKGNDLVDPSQLETNNWRRQNPSVFIKESKNEIHSDGFSFIGSFGKGQSNTEYSAGVNYQLTLNNRFFIDGSIALNSSFVQEVIMFSSKPQESSQPLAKAIPGNSYVNNSQKESETNKINFVPQTASYAHLAVNPCVGVKLTKRVSAKAGLDMQKRISNTKELSYVETNASLRELPNFDFGLTPKIGVTINSHWQADLVYRKAINNIVSKNLYYDRDYFQFQFGYKF